MKLIAGLDVIWQGQVVRIVDMDSPRLDKSVRLYRETWGPDNVLVLNQNGTLLFANVHDLVRA